MMRDRERREQQRGAENVSKVFSHDAAGHFTEVMT
jgi:hypothetical protein